MSGAYGYPHTGPPRRVGVPPLLVEVLLVVAAGFAVIGSFGVFSTYHSAFAIPQPPGSAPSDSHPVVSVLVTTGWGYTYYAKTEPAAGAGVDSVAPMVGIPLLVGALLAVVATVLLLRSRRRAEEPVTARLLGAAGCALLLSTVGTVWLQLVDGALDLDAAARRRGPGSYLYEWIVFGAGAWLILASALLAAAALAVLFVPVRDVVPPYPGTPRRAGSAPAVAAALLVVMAALAVGGSFAALDSRTYYLPDVVGVDPPRIGTMSRTGWLVTVEATQGAAPVIDSGAPLGLPLVVGALVGLVAAGLLVPARRRIDARVTARLVGAVACGVTVGGFAMVWTDLIAEAINLPGADALSPGAPPTVMHLGAGAWLVLAAAMLALVVTGLLLVPVRGGVPLPGGGPAGPGRWPPPVQAGPGGPPLAPPPGPPPRW
jgi:hypothetical protein